ncbi:TonB-dependent receptor [bacterium]|nr:TonB-dependent receptor [bacterium]
MKKWITITLFLLVSCFEGLAQSANLAVRISDTVNYKKVQGLLLLDSSSYDVQSPITIIESLEPGRYQMMFICEGYQTVNQIIVLNPGMNRLMLHLSPASQQVDSVIVRARINRDNRPTAISGLTICATKKVEFIAPDHRKVNISTNNSRQVYQSIAGLNIWENDGSGIQLNIGSRGLDPNRTSNFNTRQNGYDISADALGYPESYYTPPIAAVEQIEMIRGAASLQFGPHFGGLLNFKLKSKEDEKLRVRQNLSFGSFNYFQSFTSVGGSTENQDYYAFYQRKTGQGYRPNSGFEQNTVYLSLKQKLNAASSISFQFTHMDYLAQQPGGLTDMEYAQDPYQSKRDRNWFDVNWNLYAVDYNLKWGNQWKLNAKLFALDASRSSVGDLSRPNRPDSYRERNLISGNFQNLGMETRVLKSFRLRGHLSKFLTGFRAYKGFNHSRQGFADNTNEAHFSFLNPNNVSISDYTFPGYNLAFFMEDLFYINEKWIVNPGLRMEYIQTNANGYYTNRLVSGGRVIFEEQVEDARSNTRYFPLFGLGTSYKLKPNIELLANFTQNYRSINFSDMTMSNPNLVIDQDLQDENGYNIDLGFRGKLFNESVWVDYSLYYLNYKNRIGVGEMEVEQNGVNQLLAFRTNIGDAYSYGLESFVECDWVKLTGSKLKQWKLNSFVNYSYTQGYYKTAMSQFDGNQIEFLVPHILKTGVMTAYKNYFFSYQFSYQSEQFTDATNAEFVADATRGLIPSFGIHDVNLGYDKGDLSVKLSVNNIFNTAYFTRRALSYPGPGIITAEPRAFYLSVSYSVATKK